MILFLMISPSSNKELIAGPNHHAFKINRFFHEPDNFRNALNTVGYIEFNRFYFLYHSTLNKHITGAHKQIMKINIVFGSYLLVAFVPGKNEEKSASQS